MTRVLPEPAPARTSWGPSPWVTAAIWSGLSWRSSSRSRGAVIPGSLSRSRHQSKPFPCRSGSSRSCAGPQAARAPLQVLAESPRRAGDEMACGPPHARDDPVPGRSGGSLDGLRGLRPLPLEEEVGGGEELVGLLDVGVVACSLDAQEAGVGGV